jgi:hypothetical protein
MQRWWTSYYGIGNVEAPSSIQAVAWLFLITFSQFYNEKREQKDLKNLQFDQKSLSNIGAKDS